MKCIKKMNDFVLGILMILLSAFLVFGKITETEVKTGRAASWCDPMCGCA